MEHHIELKELSKIRIRYYWDCECGKQSKRFKDQEHTWIKAVRHGNMEHGNLMPPVLQGKMQPVHPMVLCEVQIVPIKT